MQLSPREEGWQRFSLATCRPHNRVTYLVISSRLRKAPHHFVWFAEAPGSPVPFVVSETAPGSGVEMPRDAMGFPHGMPHSEQIHWLCWNTNLWGQWNQTWQPHTVACLWQTWLMNMEWSVNSGLFEHALRTCFWTILWRIRWFWWSSFFIFCAKWRCSCLKSDNSVVTICDNLEFHNGINSLSTAMAVLRSRPDPWPLSPGDSDHLAHRCSRMVHLLSRRAFRSLSQSKSPTVQQSNMVSRCFAMVLLFVAITDLFGNPERSDSLL